MMGVYVCVCARTCTQRAFRDELEKREQAAREIQRNLVLRAMGARTEEERVKDQLKDEVRTQMACVRERERRRGVIKGTWR